MPDTRPWLEAAALAARAHRDQFRRDGRTPYASHPVRVALTVVLDFGCTDETVVTAALLHDAIEDTTVDYDDLLGHFGRPVADVVACLTKDKRMVEPQREAAYDRQLAEGPWQARLIKLADVCDNLRDSDGPSWATMLPKARRALELAGDNPRLQRACSVLRDLMAGGPERGGPGRCPSGVGSER